MFLKPLALDCALAVQSFHNPVFLQIRLSNLQITKQTHAYTKVRYEFSGGSCPGVLITSYSDFKKTFASGSRWTALPFSCGSGLATAFLFPTVEGAKMFTGKKATVPGLQFRTGSEEFKPPGWSWRSASR